MGFLILLFFCTKTYACERPWHLSWVDIYLPLHVSKWADVRDEWSLVLCDQDEGHILIVACLWFPLCQPLLLLFGFSSRFSFFFFCYLLFVLTTNKIEKQRLYALPFFFSKIGGPYSFFFLFGVFFMVVLGCCVLSPSRTRWTLSLDR